MLSVTVLAVTKVVIAVCIGVVTCHKIPNVSVTIRDFSFLITNVLLPCLTFYNTAMAVNVDVLIHCSILLLFSLIVIGLGLLCGVVMSKLFYSVESIGIPHELRHSLCYTLSYRDFEEENVSEEAQRVRRGHKHRATLQPVVCLVVSGALEAQRLEAEEVLPLVEPPSEDYEHQPFYHYASLIGCSLQNAVTLPLSLLQALATSLNWLDLAVGTSYIFIYSVVTSAAVWSLGPIFISCAKKETNKRRKIRELLEQHKKLQNCRDVATQTEVRKKSSLVASPNALVVAPLPSRDQHDTTREEDEREMRENIFADSAWNTHNAGGLEGVHPIVGWEFLEATPATCEAFPYNWREHDLIRVVYAGEFNEEAVEDSRSSRVITDFFHSLKTVSVRLFQTLVFMSVLLGVIVGVTPPLRWLFFEGPLSMLMDAIALVSQGSIPSSLLLLGVNLVGTSTMLAAAPETRLREAEQNTEFPLDDEGVDPHYAEKYNKSLEAMEFDEHASFTLLGLQQRLEPTTLSMRASGGTYADPPVQSALTGGMLDSLCAAFSLHGVWKRFVFGIIFVRLLIIPFIGFTLVMLLRKTVPSLFGGVGEKRQHDVLLLVLLCELSAPTAINCTILFNAQQYMPEKWSKMLFFQYITCTLTFVLWCTLSLIIVS